MEIIQVLFALFALFALSRAVMRVVDRRITKGEFLFWASLWVVVIIVAIHPAVATLLSEQVGISRGIDIFVYASILVLIYMVFRLIVRMDQTEKKITQLVREIALKKK